MRPIKEKIEPPVPKFGSFANRIQPQTSITGEARNPTTIRVPNTTCINMLNAEDSSGILYARAFCPSKMLQI